MAEVLGPEDVDAGVRDAAGLLLGDRLIELCRAVLEEGAADGGEVDEGGGVRGGGGGLLILWLAWGRGAGNGDAFKGWLGGGTTCDKQRDTCRDSIRR